MNLFKSIGYAYIIAGACLALIIRSVGLDLTEGQLFIDFLEGWIIVVVFIILGVVMVHTEKLDSNKRNRKD